MSSISSETVSENSPSSKREWLWFILSGIVMILGGIGAFAHPLYASFAVELLVGWTFIFGGIGQIILGARLERLSAVAWAVLVGVMGVVLGASLLANPFSGLVTLTTLVAILLIAGGVFRVVLAMVHRVGDGKLWLIIAGMLSILVGCSLLFNLLDSAVFTLGIFLGADLLMSGISLVGCGFMMKR